MLEDPSQRRFDLLPPKGPYIPPFDGEAWPSSRAKFTERGGPSEGGSSELAGAFWTQYLDSSGDTYLQCGSVTGGNGGSVTIADKKVLDSVTGVGTLSGNILYIEVQCDATVEDGLMMPGCTVTAASLTDSAAILPDNDTFTVASASGSIYREIGRWTDDAFLPSGPPGNLLASGCIGNFQVTPAT